ncbi:excinuclease ABC subunit UvrA, partial [Candidatus Peregrinibacteria bacterium]|nr:excinuclease ABC subunit UvrA [Candidatus Peregrinibacteria bacterium]
MDSIIVKGARVHNLKNVDVTIPRNKLTVVTGLSGSGKSSLAFDTIFAEGQRRYVESLSAYARQFIAQMEKPDVESIEGLSPAISIDQKTATRNPRSTVGTVTEIYDYMRLLWAKVGQVHCSICGKTLQKQSASEITETIAKMPEGKRIALLAPIVSRRKGEHTRLLDAIRREGFVRLRIDGKIVTIDEDITLDPKKHHTVDIVVDRLIIRDLQSTLTMNPHRTRLADSVELCLKKGEGTLVVLDTDTLEEQRFAENFVCLEHPEATIPPLEPRAFSFNSPHGACEACHGLGVILQVDEAAVIQNPDLSISEGAIHPWTTSASRMTYMMQLLESLSAAVGFRLTTPFHSLSSEHRHIILHGYHAPLRVALAPGAYGKPYQMTYEGVIPNLERRHRETDSSYIRNQIEDYMLELPCPACGGKRLKKEILAVTVCGKNIVEATDCSIDAAREFFEGLTLSPYHHTIAKKILTEVLARLSFLHNVGLTYLTLSRSASTLSGGEAQRIRLATQIGSALQGVLYVLDEPSIGLHQKDNARLISTMKHLRDIGNTVIVVEHDEETMRAADYLLEIGPGAGKYGGTVIAQGTADTLIRNPASVTGQYLSGKKTLATPQKRRPGNGKWLTIEDAHHHNLQHVSARLPLGTFMGISGVSGSGKSSLIHGILAPELLRVLNNAHTKPQDVGKVIGLEHLDKTIVIDQSPIGRTPRSNPITYSGIFTDIRDLFTLSPEARLRGYKSGRFSFNV